MKVINLWFDGILILDATIKKETDYDEVTIEVIKHKTYIGRLDMKTHKLVYKNHSMGRNYSVEKRG